MLQTWALAARQAIHSHRRKSALLQQILPGLQQHGQAPISAASASSAAVRAPIPDAAGASTTSSRAATASSSSAEQQPSLASTSTSLLVDVPSSQLTSQHIGNYYTLNTSLIPEAFQPFHQAFYTPRPRGMERRGGCRGLQAELAHTGGAQVMYRHCMHELFTAVGSGDARQVLLRGRSGSGKSMALVALVEWARANGWLVLYVPSAATLTSGGFFYPRPEDGTYDTIISAQHILKSLLDCHKQQLSQLPARHAPTGAPTSASTSGSDGAAALAPAAGPAGGSSLLDVVKAGLETDDDARLAVEAVLQLLAEFSSLPPEVPVLLAVDDYNALYWRTGYGSSALQRSPRPGSSATRMVRRELSVEELNLARGMRLLERTDLGACRVVCATSESRGVSPRAAPPRLPPPAAAYHVPRLSHVEAAHALWRYWEAGLLGAPPSSDQVAKAVALTLGSGADLRRLSLKVSALDLNML